MSNLAEELDLLNMTDEAFFEFEEKIKPYIKQFTGEKKIKELISGEQHKNDVWDKVAERWEEDK